MARGDWAWPRGTSLNPHLATYVPAQPGLELPPLVVGFLISNSEGLEQSPAEFSDDVSLRQCPELALQRACGEGGSRRKLTGDFPRESGGCWESSCQDRQPRPHLAAVS